MTKSEYTQLTGKTPKEVAYFLHDFFVAPLDWAIGVKGELDQSIGALYDERRMLVTLGDKIGCGTVGCMGSWVSAFFFDNHTAVKNKCGYGRATDLMVDFFSPHDWYKALDPVWHNAFVDTLFYSWDDAYNGDKTTTLSDVKRYFESAIENLMEME